MARSAPDGRYLAVVFGGVDAAGAVTPARVGVIDVAARRLLAVPGAVMDGGEVGWAVSWSPDGAWLLLSAPLGPVTEQLAAWRPGDTVLHVPRCQPRPANTQHGQASGTAQSHPAQPDGQSIGMARY